MDAAKKLMSNFLALKILTKQMEPRVKVLAHGGNFKKRAKQKSLDFLI